MAINNKSILFALLCTALASCSLESPKFTVEDNCIIVKRKMWFQSVHITNLSTNETYSLRRNRLYDGAHQICFTNIPKGYYLVHKLDTLNPGIINFEEGQSIEISHDGGDRSDFRILCKVEHGVLIPIKSE